MNLNIGDLCITDPTLVIFHPGVNLPIMLQHLGKRVEPQGAIRALVMLVIRHVAFGMACHPLRLSSPKSAANLMAVNPFIIHP